MTTSLSVPVIEVFSSFEAEGTLIGSRQIVVRLARCDLRCSYCPTPESFPTPAAARVQTEPGGEHEDRLENPVPIADLIAAIGRLDDPPGMHAAVSVTGGEPLLHPNAVCRLADAAHELGLAIHVDTAGHRPGAVEHVLPHVEYVSPDLKLQSATGQPTPWDAHRETFALLESAGKGLAVKAVFSADTTPDEIMQAAAFAAEHLPSAPLVLQPVTKHPGGPGIPNRLTIFRLQAAAGSVHPDVRVIPRIHALLGLR